MLEAHHGAVRFGRLAAKARAAIFGIASGVVEFAIVALGIGWWSAFRREGVRVADQPVTTQVVAQVASFGHTKSGVGAIEGDAAEHGIALGLTVL